MHFQLYRTKNLVLRSEKNKKFNSRIKILFQNKMRNYVWIFNLHLWNGNTTRGREKWQQKHPKEIFAFKHGHHPSTDELIKLSNLILAWLSNSDQTPRATKSNFMNFAIAYRRIEIFSQTNPHILFNFPGMTKAKCEKLSLAALHFTTSFFLSFF